MYPVAEFIFGQLNLHTPAFTPDFCPQSQAVMVDEHFLTGEIQSLPAFEQYPRLPRCDLKLHQPIGLFVIDDSENGQQEILIAVGSDSPDRNITKIGFHGRTAVAKIESTQVLTRAKIKMTAELGVSRLLTPRYQGR